MTSCFQAMLAFFAAALVASSAREVDIENHPAFKFEDVRVAHSNNTLRVASFNIQVFGVKKMENFHVVTCLTKILIRYDITLIEEIRDESDTAVHELLQKVNSMGAGTYAMALSERLGRSTSKEQYAYFYK